MTIIKFTDVTNKETFLKYLKEYIKRSDANFEEIEGLIILEGKVKKLKAFMKDTKRGTRGATKTQEKEFMKLLDSVADSELGKEELRKIIKLNLNYIQAYKGYLEQVLGLLQ